MVMDTRFNAIVACGGLFFMIIAFALYVLDYPYSVYSAVFTLAFVVLISFYGLTLLDKYRFEKAAKMEDTIDAMGEYTYTLDESYTDYGTDAVIINMDSSNDDNRS